jgi:hypothetical protein
MNNTISNSTMTFTNETDFMSTIDNENTTITTTDVTLETSTENVTFDSSETNSTLPDVDTTTAEVFHNSTMKFIETTTQTDTTTAVRSTSCVDSEFECCINGETSAQVIEFFY